ncbi:hypothetical protein [Enterobacter ludwigii]|uniref:hypothetical protein n=1 Tax=Enterobacter ludwigii TaxID=299767 RepID=UPI0018C29323|nr:hypothetical protein [Enterobacter ludwigii]MBG0575985.1 hypothetical protein [Enterobacter ludwigii]
MGNYRINLSTKILNLVEGLPRFRKGIISDLQGIRERQHQLAEKSKIKRKSPEDARMSLETLTLTITFEHEDYNNVIKGLNRYFPKNERIQGFVGSLKDSSDSLHASSWSNLGFIFKENGSYVSDVTVDSSLPSNISSISLSFHRILPSVSCIIFTCHLDDDISNELNKLQDNSYLGQVEFKKLWPLQKLSYRYSMKLPHHSSRKVIECRKDVIRKETESWIKKNFKWNVKDKYIVSYIDTYRISGCPTDAQERKDWLNKHNVWLSDFDITPISHDTCNGLNFMISKPNRDSSMPLDIMTRFEESEKSKNIDEFEFKIGAMAISSAIYNLLNKYEDKITTLRSSGFKNLYKRTKMTRRTQKNMQEIKRTLVIISRLDQELQECQGYIALSLSEIGHLTYSHDNGPYNFAESTISRSDYILKQIKNAAHTIDTGLTNYLSTQNIYVMYKLQKWMFFLTIVVTIATLLGVLSGWENAKTIILSWFQ